MEVPTIERFLPYLQLCKRAFSEVSKDPFNPDLELFMSGFENGLLHGHIEDAGFYIYALNKDVFSSKLRADVLTVWVRPECRNTLKAARIVRRLIKDAKAKGAQSVVFSVSVESANLFSWSYHYGNPTDFIFKRVL